MDWRLPSHADRTYELPTPARTLPCVRSGWSAFYWLPIGRSHQMLFAEAFRQTLAVKMPPSTALTVAAKANRSWRFRAALFEMAIHARGGYTLAVSLSRTGVAVRKDLLAALAVGEERGLLQETLALFARRIHPHPQRCLATSLRRSAVVARFAAALSLLLTDRPLTVELVEDAARLAAGDESRFLQVVRRVTRDMRDGTPFAHALAFEFWTFDWFLCALISATSGRDELRAALARLNLPLPSA